MPTIIINQDLSVANDNKVVLEALQGLCDTNKFNESIIELEGLLKFFSENGIEFGLCVKFGSDK